MVERGGGIVGGGEGGGIVGGGEGTRYLMVVERGGGI